MKKEQFDQLLETLQEPMVNTLRSWLKIPSLKSDPLPGAPFGSQLRQMLDLTLESCRALGFDARDIDGYAGDARMGEGNEEDALGILAHIDVVPAGDGWTRDPFGAQLEDGVVYGRGTSDDKGPLAAALYAMYAVKEAGIPLKRQVKLIFGCDEETGMEDMKYYKKHAIMPRSGFSPDASYPIINLEKGSVGLRLKAPLAKEGVKVLRLNIGERTNVIPGAASALIKGTPDMVARVDEISRKYGWPVKAQLNDEGVLLTATGINGHAAYPETARNAIGQLLITLKELGVQGALAELADKIGTTYYGEGLGIQARDAASGPLTCNLGILRLEEDGQIFGTLDIRYPLLINGARLRDIIAAHLPGFEVTQVSFKEPHYVPESSTLVLELLNAYHEVTGLEKKTLSTGGGTYARMLEEGVAFGASLPGDADLAHQADEHITVESLMKNLKIFAYAIIKLAAEKGALE